MTIDLKKLNFGSDDAERDAKNGFLDKVFLKTMFYERVRAGQRELVVGRKGAGKSALCLTLKNSLESEGKTALLITPKALSAPKIKTLKVDSVNPDESYVLSWKYVFLVEIAKKILITLDQKKNRKFLRAFQKNLISF